MRQEKKHKKNGEKTITRQVSCVLCFRVLCCYYLLLLFDAIRDIIVLYTICSNLQRTQNHNKHKSMISQSKIILFFYVRDISIFVVVQFALVDFLFWDFCSRALVHNTSIHDLVISIANHFFHIFLKLLHEFRSCIKVLILSNIFHGI